MSMAYYHCTEGSELGVWRIEEPEAFFKEALADEGFDLNAGLAIAHPEKRLQWMASRYLLSQLYPGAISLYDDRKPYLHNGPALSISHSKTLAGIMISEHKAGLDLQWPDPKLLKVAPRFAHPDELLLLAAFDEIHALTSLWAIKEAVFKHYGTLLPFRQIYLESFNVEQMRCRVRVFRKGNNSMLHLGLARIDDTIAAFLCE